MINYNTFSYEDKKDEEELRCPQCKWFFSQVTKPYILPCNHNICQECLNSLKLKGRNICPLCKKELNIKELDLLQVNYAFLNLVVKILNTKIIFCNKCCKILYWKDHYTKCDQSHFLEPTNIIDKLKDTYENSVKFLKLYKNQKIIIMNYKNKIYSKIKTIIDNIHTKQINYINNEFQELTEINIISMKNIDFQKSKKNLINFLELCLPFDDIFNISEILNNLEIIFPGYIRKYKLKKERKLKGLMNQQKIFLNKGNNLFEKDHLNLNNNNLIRIRDNEDLNFFQSKNNNRIYSLKDEENKKSNKNSKNKINNGLSFKNESLEKDQKIKRTRTISKTKHKKFNIFDLVGQPSLEMESYNQIIVGLKDIKVNRLKSKKENENISNEEWMNKNKRINIKLKDIDNNINKNIMISNSYKKNKKENNNIESENNQNKKLIIYNNFMREVDKSIDMNKFNKRDRYQSIKQENIPIIIEEEHQGSIKESHNKEKEIKDEKNHHKDIKKMTALFNQFNKTKDIVYNLKGYYSINEDLYTYINSKIEYNIFALKKIYLSNYNLLLNDISYKIIKENKRTNIISFLENTKQIILFNMLEKKYIFNNLETVLKKYPNFKNSMCIEYDDKDLIFISGGEENTNYYSSDRFIIISLSNEKIELEGILPTRKSFHSNIYLEGKLYFLGGYGPNKRCSSNCFYYSVNDKKWNGLPNLNKPRVNFSLCILNNSNFYIFRGKDDNEVLDSIEYLDLNANNKSWIIITPIDYGYAWFPAENSLAVNYGDDKILICGGEDENGNLYKETFLFDANNKNIYRGQDLFYGASFRYQGSKHKKEIFGIDIRNNYSKRKNIGIHFYNFEKSDWNLIIA